MAPNVPHTVLVTPSSTDVQMQSTSAGGHSLSVLSVKDQFEAFKQASCSALAVSPTVQGLHDRVIRFARSHQGLGHQNPSNDPRLEPIILAPAVARFRADVSSVCHRIGDENVLQYAPDAPPGAFLRSLSREVTSCQAQLAQTASVLNARLASQACLEAAQSMISRPEGHLFRHHAEFFDCPSRDDHLALQQRLAQVEQELATSRSVPQSSSAASLLDHCQTDLTPAQSGDVCRTLVRACWVAHLPVPAWLDLLSKSYISK